MTHGTNHQPIVLQREKTAYQLWLVIHRDFLKTERFVLGQRISNLFLIILESTYTASYLSIERKVKALAEIISHHDELKFFIQLAWEIKLIPTSKYAELSDQLVKIGQMLGGWKKDMERKTPAEKTGER